VAHLRDKVVVFTNKDAPSPHYGSWKVGQVKLDIRELRPRDVIGVAISPDRQSHQNVLKLKALSDNNWRQLVDLIEAQGLQVSDQQVANLLGYSAQQIQQSLGEIAAARSNMFGVVRLLHDPLSRLLSGTIDALARGAIVVLDLSLLSSAAGNILAGLLLRRLFSHNQENFTGGQPIIPVIAVIEEAQSVLGRNLDDSSPYVEWVKEGRKYELGTILITQQPGSMAPEIMSQADNWFCFHLLSEGDAGTLGKYNSHFSDDVLAHLIGEPIPGNCFMWSAPHQPFVLPVRVRNFEDLYRGNVVLDAGAKQVEGGLANQVLTALSGAGDRLKDALIARLGQPNVKWVRVPGALPGGTEGVGVYSGQLYFLIKEIKTPADTQSEEQLKGELLTTILGEGVLQVKEHNGKEYYCAAKAQWEEALGRKLTVKEAS